MKENKNNSIELEQYRIYIDSVEKNSDRRINQNNIYLTINLAFISYICTQSLDLKYTIIVLIVGIIHCIIWLFTVINYAKRNSIKFEIINKSEYGKLYKEEWTEMSKMTKLTLYEKISPITFAALYIAIFIINIIK